MPSDTQDYGPLRETHQRVQEILDGRDTHDRQPTNARDAQEQAPARDEQPRGYGPLKETHQKVQEILASRGPQDQQPTNTREAEEPTPTRPPDQQVRSPGSPDGPDLVSMERWGIAQNKYNNARLRQNSAAEKATTDDLYARHPGLTRDDTNGPDHERENDQRRGPPRDGR